MALIENVVHINRSPEEVFDALADPRSELQWNPDMQRIEELTDGPVGVGSRFQGPDVTVEITEFDRPYRWETHSEGPITVDLQISLTPSETGSVLRSQFNARAHGRYRLLFPIFLMVMRRAEKKTLQRGRAYVEAGAGADRSSVTSHETDRDA